MEKIFNMSSSILVLFFAVFMQTVIHECGANKCSSLGSFTNGKITYDKSLINWKYPVSTIAYYTCNFGYSQPYNQGRTAICLESGSWRSRGPAKYCSRHTGICQRLNIPNGEVQYSSVYPNDPQQRIHLGLIAHHFCNERYQRTGNRSLYCNSSGGWDELNHLGYAYQSPACLATCSPYSVPNGRATYSRSSRQTGSYTYYIYGTYAYLECTNGFKRLTGTSTVYCKFNGEWSSDDFICFHAATPSPPPSKGWQCFPSSANVLLESGKSVKMSELQIGDLVQTVSSTGTISYSEVSAFLKKQPNIMTKCKSIATGNETLTITGNHLLYARKNSADQFNPLFSDQLSIGDEVLVQRNDMLTPEKVINLSDIDMPGAYVPLIKEGKIMVDGVLASCYADIHHDVAHFTMIPMQKFPAVMEWIFGDDAGYQVYVSTARKLGILLLPNDNIWCY